jgi:hypothetical protein
VYRPLGEVGAGLPAGKSQYSLVLWYGASRPGSSKESRPFSWLDVLQVLPSRKRARWTTVTGEE